MRTEPSGRRLVSLWIEQRLHEREAIDWAIGAHMKVGDGLGAEIRQLLDYLSAKARDDVTLDVGVRRTWALLARATREKFDRPTWQEGSAIRRALSEPHTFTDELTERLVAWARPRLQARRLSDAEREINAGDGPSSYVDWEFHARCGSLDHSVSDIDEDALRKVSVQRLLHLAHLAGNVLADAIEVAGEVGWITDEFDRTSFSVSSVGELPSLPPPADQDDPDALDSQFAPLVRLITKVFRAIAAEDINAAKLLLQSWATRTTDLFIRIRAFGMLSAQVVSGRELGRFLVDLPDDIFWGTTRFPEVTFLRVTRWSATDKRARLKMEGRLSAGPTFVRERTDVENAESRYHWLRDTEIARLTDSGANVSDDLRAFVVSRRLRDPQFPAQVPPYDLAVVSMSWTSTPDGDAATFEGVDTTDLVQRLATYERQGRHWDGNDAEAYVRQHRGAVVRTLHSFLGDESDSDVVWKLVLRSPEALSQTADGLHTFVEIVRFFVAVPEPMLTRLSSDLSYWLDIADERIGNTQSEPLWSRLVQVEQAKATADETSDEDFSFDSLNGPLGHLISYYLRRCPTMPPTAPRPSLPGITHALRHLSEPARLVMAERMAVHANYFVRADSSWLEEFVLAPMRTDTKQGQRLWESFSRYGKLPVPELWRELEDGVYSHLSQTKLSSESLRRLSEIVVVVWAMSKASDSDYVVHSAKARNALSLASSEARAAGAWQYANLFSRDEHSEGPTPWSRWGEIFFRELWPNDSRLQTPDTANDFARVPGSCERDEFERAVTTVLPYLRPFEIWDIETALHLAPDDERIVHSPGYVLALVAACVPKDWGTVFQLDQLLSALSASDPKLPQDERFRQLRRHVETRP